MATIVSTSTRTLDINSLFERPGDDSAETALKELIKLDHSINSLTEQ